MGCHAVYNILSAKNEVEGFESNPLFLQAVQSGLISNPHLLDRIQERQTHERQCSLQDTEREKLYLEIGNMWCPSCAEVIRLVLLSKRGTLHAVIDYCTDLASIEYNPKEVGKEAIMQAISSFGYEAKLFGSKEKKDVSLYLRFIVASFCSLNIMMLAYPLYATYFNYDGEGYGNLFAWISMVTSLPVLFYSGLPIWKRCFNAFRVGVYGMEILVTIGVFSAFAISFYELMMGGTRVYFDSMSIVIAFMLLGKIIEAKAKFSSKSALLRLSRQTPRRGRKLFPDGKEEFVLVKEIQKGDILIALAGEKIVLDGIVDQGSGACDESLMTGESKFVSKLPNSSVLAGTVVVQGQLRYAVTADENETALHRIIQMIEQDIDHKSMYVRAADKIAGWFVPCVLLIALTTFIMSFLFSSENQLQTAFLRALSILLISCPCALGVAAPAAESYLLNGLASLGVIVRNRGCLPYIGKEAVIVFDKTGTVTEGRFQVVKGLENLSSNDRNAIFSIVRKSNHPVACAVSLNLTGIKKPVEEMQEVIGYGLRGVIDGISYVIGSERFLTTLGIVIQKGAPENTDLSSLLYVVKDNICIAVIELADTIRPEIKPLLKSLKGIKTILLSGDGKEAVAAVANTCGFDEYYPLCTPLEKREFIERLKRNYGTIAMVGDGMNDAPALTVANVGISVVTASDMSINVSDILLTTDLSVLTKMRSFALLGQRIVKQNLFWAFFYNVVGIALAAFGFLTPIFAAFAMSISSLTVLFNAQRLKKHIT